MVRVEALTIRRLIGVMREARSGVVLLTRQNPSLAVPPRPVKLTRRRLPESIPTKYPIL